MSTIWFTADLHLGHRLVAGHRGFGEDVAAHDADILARWRAKVRPDDAVWVLGDVTMSRLDEALAALWVLPGEKHLVAGNHDSCHPMHAKAHKQQQRYLEVFASVQPFARLKIGAQQVALSHFPYATDRGFEARYPQWRLPDLGMPLLHGHTHSTERRTSGHELHVGLDAWGLELVPLETVAAELRDMRGPDGGAG